MISAHTRAAWQAADYRVRADAGWLTTRIGEPSQALAALLAAHGSGHAALVTACNPRGRQLDEASNRRRLAALQQSLADRGYRWLEAEGASPGRDWVEPSLFVPGLGGAACATLMRTHDQLAWLEYDAQGSSRLCESGLTQDDGETA